MRMEVPVPVEHNGPLPVPLDLNIDLDLLLDAQEHHQLTPPPSHMLMRGQGQGQGHGEDHIESLSYTHSFLSPFLYLTAFSFSVFTIRCLILSFFHLALILSCHLFIPSLIFQTFSSLLFVLFPPLFFSLLFSPTPLFSYHPFSSLLLPSLSTPPVAQPEFFMKYSAACVAVEDSDSEAEEV